MDFNYARIIFKDYTSALSRIRLVGSKGRKCGEFLSLFAVPSVWRLHAIASPTMPILFIFIILSPL